MSLSVSEQLGRLKLEDSRGVGKDLPTSPATVAVDKVSTTASTTTEASKDQGIAAAGSPGN